jgi:hypothetical protein
MADRLAERLQESSCLEFCFMPNQKDMRKITINDDLQMLKDLGLETI